MKSYWFGYRVPDRAGSLRSGLVVAPAGCGKTQWLVDELKGKDPERPSLLLTHTNAGVSALRKRLQRANVPPSAFRLSTIDGWALKLCGTFPERSEVPSAALGLTEPSVHYPIIRECAARLVSRGHIADCLTKSYSNLFVDEYQDCTVRQHELVKQLAALLPTLVVGDQMQAIFGFNVDDPLIAWDVVQTSFPVVNELRKPWRWINAGAEDLGEWLIKVRGTLERKEPVNLRDAPQSVKWIELNGGPDDQVKMISAARWTGHGSKHGVMVIGDSRSPESRHSLASGVRGAEVIEPVELKQMVQFFQELDLRHGDAIHRLFTFAEKMITGVGRGQLTKRLDTLRRARSRKPPSDVELAALNFELNRTPLAAAEIFMALEADPSMRVYRPTVLHGCIRTLLTSNSSPTLDLRESAIQIREQFRT
ncbi:MAG: AAA family ATPase, partial [Actinobacteria bacterium]|nr:AAA family ATPase [Actinomycetota bacterium]